jgi:UDP-N-acetylglucosamine 2-epimerase (non-hydrolysing)
MAGAALVLTDSGGIQEETLALGVPCVTLRRNTERPITVNLGMNRLAGVKERDILQAVEEALACKSPHIVPELWDGRAASRILDVIERWFAQMVNRMGADLAPSNHPVEN